MSCLPKPVLRGHITKSGLKLLFGGLAFGAINSALFHFLVAVPRKEAYHKFFETYDADAHYKDLVKWGYATFPKFLEKIQKGGE